MGRWQLLPETQGRLLTLVLEVIKKQGPHCQAERSLCHACFRINEKVTLQLEMQEGV